jgi:hypothetical protein
MSSPYKLEPVPNFLSEVQARSTLWKSKSINGEHYKAVVRNPCYCEISGGGYSLPDKDYHTFSSVYGTFKLKPILQSVTLQLGGDYGLTMSIDAKIKCFTLDDFEKVSKAFCSFKTKDVSVKFGYAKPFAPKEYSSKGEFTGFQVCKYSFNTDDDGSWTVSFTAVGPGEALQSLDISTPPPILTNGNLQVILERPKLLAPVHTLSELLLFHGQGNGTTAKDRVDDGTVFKCDKPVEMGYAVSFKCKQMLISSGVLTSIAGKTIMGLFQGGDDNYLYYTLEYAVNMWNKIASTSYPDTAESKVTIEFDEKYSVAYMHKSIRSARPLNVLLLGDGLGNYDRGVPGKDFETVCGMPGELNCNLGVTGLMRQIDLKKILIERSTLHNALCTDKPEKKKSETNDVKETQEQTVTVKQFFNTIFETIDRATGGGLKLRLAQHPEAGKSGGDLLKKLIVVDENNGKADQLTCVVFDPIDGDGSTRSCSLSADGGSQTYQASMFAGSHNSGDAVVTAAGDNPATKRIKEYNSAVKAFNSLLITDKKIQNSGFAEEQLKALEDANSAFAKYAAGQNIEQYKQLVYPGLSIDLTIDGCYGIRPGCAISTTQLPKSHKPDKHLYFYVDTVTHEFDGSSSDWSTKITGKFNKHKPLNPVRL